MSYCICLEEMLQTTMFKGFPIVQGQGDMTLVGYIGRSELKYLIGKWTFKYVQELNLAKYVF